MQLIKREHHPAHTVAMALFITVAVTLTGCATPYKEPTGNSIASIEFVNDGSEPMVVHFHGGAEECTDRMKAASVQPNAQHKLAVAAGKNEVFTVGMTPNGKNTMRVFGVVGVLASMPFHKGCTPTIDFVPEVGRAYEFRMSSEGNTCNYQFYSKPSATQRAEKPVFVAFTEREWIRAMGEGGPFCKKK